MLRLGAIRREIRWPEAGISLVLSPLPDDVHQRLVEATTVEVRDTKGLLERIKRDATGYAQEVGLACIKDWDGVIDADGTPVKCTPEAVREFMLIEPAQAFVFDQVRGLALYIEQEASAAKNV